MLNKFYRNHSVIGTILRFIKFVTTFIIVSSVICITGLAGLYFYFARELPNIQTLKEFKPPVVSEVFSANGDKIGEFWTECRFWVPLEAIPKQVVNAFISAEDSRFYEHSGVDMIGIFRAMVENLKAGHIVQGGSTITQQITRSILLSSERKLARKVKEAILATRIERNLNKEQILELYLNQIFLGNRAYGVKAAARNYFHKSLNELTLAETAMIAGMPTAPSSDSPVHNIEKARDRQLYVLDRMYELGYIKKDQKESAANEVLTIYAAGTDKDFNNNYAPYFVENVRRILIEKYGEKVLYQAGLKIYTTADLKMNISGQHALRHGLEALDKRQGFRGPIDHTDDVKKFASDYQKELLAKQNGSVKHLPETASKPTSVTLLPDTFYKAVVTGFEGRDVKILVGDAEGIITHDGYKWARSYNTDSAGYDGADYLSDAKTKLKAGDIINVKLSDKQGEFVLAQKPLVQGALYSMDPHTGAVKVMIGGYDFSESEFNRSTQALRQPGSSFKPFIYAAALDKGYRFNTPILDGPVQFFVGPNQPLYSPTNYGNKYSGLTTFESDLIHSRNVPTVKIANDIGLHYVTAYIRKLGLTTQIDKYLSMALGSNGVILSEMVDAYATFANGGIRPDAYFITKVIDSDGTMLEEYSPPKSEEADASEVTEEMGKKLKNLNTRLFDEGQKAMEKDGLKLTQEDIKILYGEVIPDGYTITPQTAYLMTKLLMGVVDRGTGTRVKALGRPVAGKTGTTNDETDCWFIGFTPDLASGVWVGFDNIAKVGSLETGGKTAAPIFLEYMKEATKDMEAKKFEPPKGLREERVASLTGGSAVYFKGFSLMRDALSAEQKATDRAVNFFEEDLNSNGGAKNPSSPPPPPPPSSQKSDLDDYEY